MTEELTPKACPHCKSTPAHLCVWWPNDMEERRPECLETELNAVRGELENAKSALGEHPESPVNIAQRISEIRDEGRAHFHAVTNLLRERDQLRATNAGLLEALRGLTETLDAHDAVCYDCDRSGEKYCDCLDGVILKARAAIAGAEGGSV